MISFDQLWMIGALLVVGGFGIGRGFGLKSEIAWKRIARGRGKRIAEYVAPFQRQCARLRAERDRARAELATLRESA